MKTEKSLENRLKDYNTLSNTLKKAGQNRVTKTVIGATALLAASVPADAKIKYLDIPDETRQLNNVTGTFKFPPIILDLNNDGNPDFSFYGIRSFGPSSTSTFLQIMPIPTPFNNVVASLNHLPVVLNEGSVIGSVLGADKEWGQNILAKQMYSGTTVSKKSGNFSNKIGYLGFRIRISGALHYGWMRVGTTLNKAPGTSSVTVYEYAYEDIPNKLIKAGQKPEPPIVPVSPAAALGAFGLVGLFAYYRSRKKEQTA